MFSNNNVEQKYSYHCLRISKDKNFLFPYHNKYTVPHDKYPPNSIFIFKLQKTNFYSTFTCSQLLLCNSYKTEEIYCLQHCCKYKYSSCHSNTFSVLLLHTQHFSTLWISLHYQQGHQYMKLGEVQQPRIRYHTEQNKMI